MPALSPTMTSGNIGAWHKAPGDALAPGDVLVEIETDKAQMDFEFQDEGVLAKILLPSGQKDVPVGAPIAVLMEEDGDISLFENFSAEKRQSNTPPAASEPVKTSADASAPSSEPTAGSSSPAQGQRLQTALDRQPKGRVMDHEVASVEKASSTASTYKDIPASSMRKIIASRLTESKLNNPHYYVSSKISVSKLLKLRAVLNEQSQGVFKISVNDFLIKALGVAANKIPSANSAWIETNGDIVIRQHSSVDVSVAVATPAGLVTPVVRNVGALGLKQISSSVKDMVVRAKDNKLSPQEYQGGTITISNLGMNPAVDRFTAVINPPQSTIIAVGAVSKVAIPGPEGSNDCVQWDDQIVITGSFDHKVVDGATGAEFMKELKHIIEHPLEFLL